MCNATYYMYSSRSNDHAIESNACAGFRVETGIGGSGPNLEQNQRKLEILPLQI